MWFNMPFRIMNDCISWWCLSCIYLIPEWHSNKKRYLPSNSQWINEYRLHCSEKFLLVNAPIFYNIRTIIVHRYIYATKHCPLFNEWVLLLNMLIKSPRPEFLDVFSSFPPRSPPPQRHLPFASKPFVLKQIFRQKSISLGRCFGWHFRDLDRRSLLWHWLITICLSAR